MEFFSVLRTRRLTLRCLEERDTPTLLAIHSDSEYALTGRHPNSTPEDASAYIRQTRSDPSCLSWTALLRATGEPAGMVFLWHLDRMAGSAELGYEFLPSFRGQGLASEAARLIAGYGLTILGLRRITARSRPENHASIRILEKLGFSQVGQVAPTGAAPLSHLFFERTNAPD